MTLGEHFDIEREAQKRLDIIELLEDLGKVPDGIIDSLEHITDSKELSRLHKAAATAESIEDFEASLHHKCKALDMPIWKRPQSHESNIHATFYSMTNCYPMSSIRT